MKSPIFAYFTLKLQFLDSCPENISGRALHGLAFRLLNDANSEIAESVHKARFKPFTISLLKPDRNNKLLFSWRWTILDFNLYYLLTSLLYSDWTKGTERSLESHKFVIANIDIDSGPGSRLWTIDDLADAAEKRTEMLESPRGFELKFVSPTAFKISGNMAYLFPTPLLVWGSLSRRLGGVAPGFFRTGDMIEFWEEMLISDYSIETRMLEFPEHVIKGFVGRIRYTAPKKWDTGRILKTCILQEAAPFLGVGAKTPQGMGQCRIDKV